MAIQIINGYATQTTTDEKSHTFRGALYDQDNNLIEKSQRNKFGDNEWNPDDPVKVSREINPVRLKGNSIYLGHYTGHYGHFLLETLNRFWFLVNVATAKEYDNFVFHPFLHKTPSPNAFSPAKICFECFGIDFKKFKLIGENICFDNITIPESCFDINYSVDKRMAGVYGAIKKYANRLPSSKPGIMNKILGWRESDDLKIYLSRRKAKGYHPMQNEVEIEKIFVKAGFRVLHPERWSFEQQLAIFDRTKVLAGVEGSALHNSVFMQSGAQVVSLGTPRVPSGHILNQDFCNSLSGVNIHYVEFKGKLNSKSKALYDVAHIERELANKNLVD